MSTKLARTSPKRLCLSITAILAIGLCGLMPATATAAWNIGEPIVTYWGGDPLSESLAQLSAAGGYNLVQVYTTPTSANLNTQLGYAATYGLRTMLSDTNGLLTVAALSDSTKLAQLDALIDQFKASPTAYAYFLDDEPNTTEFSGLAQLTAYIKQRDPDHLCYVNAWGATAGTKQGLFGPSAPQNTSSTLADYTTYMSQYMGTLQPELLSYDYYQMYYATPAPKWDLPNYFYNLATARANAQVAGIPFMNIVQACAWNPSQWRNPDAGELRFLAYTTLAYGAQGISYFNYINWGQYYLDNVDRGGILQRVTGLPTQTYYNLIPTNTEFKNIAGELQGLKSIGAYHKGDAPPGTVRLPGDSPFTLLTDMPNTTFDTGAFFSAPVKGLLFGLFGNGAAVSDADHLLVVNLDYVNAITTTIVGTEELATFDATTGHWTKLGSNQATLNIAAGGGILVAFASVVPEPSTIVLLTSGLVALAALARRRKSC